ncbi:MAG: hypothetical protein ACOCWH_07190 [Spirochaetota bacterium]
MKQITTRFIKPTAAVLAAALVLGSALTAAAQWKKPNLQTHNQLQPVGWSEDGKFAFAVQTYTTTTTPSIIYTTTFSIVNTVNDEILYTGTDTFTDESMDESNNPTGPIDQAWSKVGTEFQDACRKHGIKPKASSMQTFPADIEGSVYTATIAEEKTDTTGNPTYFEVWIEKKGSGKKKITSVDTNNFPKNLAVKTIDVRGMFMSPYEQQIVVIYSIQGTVKSEYWEMFGYSGSNLSAGFR